MWWEWILQPAVALLALAGLVAVNVLVWVFAWGKGRGQTNTRLNAIEEKMGNPQILPDCNEIFTEIKERLAGLEGKVETMLIIMTESQKNSEKEKITGR